jgi:replicative DNA helicase
MSTLAPHDIEAEMAVLGALLLSDETRNLEALAQLAPEDFYRETHGKIFAAARKVIEEGKPLDVVTLQDELKRRGELETIGGYVYLVELADFVPTAASMGHYAGIVRERSTLRKMQEFSVQIHASAIAGDQTAAVLLADIEKRIEELRPAQERPLTHNLRDLLRVAVDAQEERLHGGGGITGLRTGFHMLDWMTGGLHAGELTIIAARPSMGKSVLAANIAMNAAKAQLVVALFSVEMTAVSVADRIICGEADIDSHTLRSGRLSADQAHAQAAALERLWDAPLVIDENSAATPAYIRAKCKQIKAQEGALDLIVVDYLQLLTMGAGAQVKAENRNSEVEAISRALKQIARDFNVPLIAVAQLSRNVERREEKRPLLSDLRDSGSIEQDADLVLFLYRVAYYARKAAEERGESFDEGEIDEAEVIIAKQRNGPTGAFPLGFQGKYFRFVNLLKEDRL